jgi:formylglycine-generating enzyme required for sulfatase activity
MVDLAGRRHDNSTRANSLGWCWVVAENAKRIAMKTFPNNLALLAVLALASVPTAHAQIAPGELVAPKMEISGGNLNFTVQPSVSGRNYQLQWSDTMAGGTWMDLGVVRSGDGTNLLIFTPYDAGVQKRFFRVALVEASPAPEGFSLISAGSFEMGQTGIVTPVHSVQVSAFYMAKYEVTKALWNEVRTWGLTHGYTDLAVGAGKAANHPVQTISWYDMVRWCNARSEKELLTPCYTVSEEIYKTGSSDAVVCKWTANGYRLPTEAEWEKAARGGLSGKLFPWGDTISHSQANYCVYSSDGTTNYYSYDVTPRPGYTINYYYHPTYAVNGEPYTSPVGSLTGNANGYGLYDMAGNVWERCWDWYDSYPSASQTDPRGASSGSARVCRGGGWGDRASYCRAALRINGGYPPSFTVNNIGLRLARSSVP